jgi:hypothetical protein
VWTDDQLADAVKSSACWRDVIRALGITTNSEGTILRVKRDVARLALDVSHFKGSRTWDDGQLKRAVAEAMSWDDVFTSLGLLTPKKETRTRVQGHAIRLGLDLEHLTIGAKGSSASAEWPLDPMRLRDAAAPLAAAWFMLRGCTVSFPVEQAVYDLLVQSNEEILRIQAKTTTASGATGQVNVARRGDRLLLHRGRRLQHVPHPESRYRRSCSAHVAGVWEVHRRERGRVAWGEYGCSAADGGRVAVGVRGLRWRRLVVGWGRLSAGVSCLLQ